MLSPAFDANRRRTWAFVLGTAVDHFFGTVA